MVLKPNYVLLLCLVVGTMTPVVWAQHQSTYSPAPAGKPAKQKDGFIDYALKRINPNDLDYGQCISEGRRILLSETLENGYFWSNIVSLGLLGCFLIFIVHRRKVQQRDELMNADSFCQIHNALLRAEVQVDEATKRNHQLMETLAAASEVVSGPPQVRNETPEPPSKKESAGAATGSSTPATVPVKSGSMVSTIAVGTAPAKEAKPAPQLGLFTSDVEQIAQVNALQQQLIRCQERVKNLSRQLNDAERRLQEEQQKNRSLKGE
jgi:hypothetical protein